MNLRDWMEKRGVTIREMVKMTEEIDGVGVSDTSIKKFRLGKDMRLSTAVVVCEATGGELTLDDLADGLT